MTLDETGAYIALNALPAIGPNNFHHLLARFGSATAVFNADAHSLTTVEGVGPKTAEQIRHCAPEKTATAERKRAEKERVDIVTLFDARYPANLKLAHNPPPVLYIAGTIAETDRLAIGVVGTRSPTPYGKIMGENFSATLAKRGFTIVSGLARGIDTTAHRAAIESGGKTIAVLGCGLDTCYPPENRALFDKIRAHGALVSQFPFGAGPEKRNFPIRNRIISLLSLGVLVIEAGDKSGTLITAYGALDEGREVFALPGRLDSPKSVGCHRLIQKGAKLVTTPDDVIAEFPPEVQAVTQRPEEPATHSLTAEAEAIVSLLTGGERHVDSIIGGTGLPPSVALGLLLELELKGIVRQLPGKIFAKR